MRDGREDVGAGAVLVQASPRTPTSIGTRAALGDHEVRDHVTREVRLDRCHRRLGRAARWQHPGFEAADREELALAREPEGEPGFEDTAGRRIRHGEVGVEPDLDPVE